MTPSPMATIPLLAAVQADETASKTVVPSRTTFKPIVLEVVFTAVAMQISTIPDPEAVNEDVTGKPSCW